ncbi:hypothetical protein HPB48_020377 [Haemaphysalis longicornis]|uniref:Uncharacterized protein n=1 Tax=Haemaphysalis longicornis TaxID=44386 RepID=A0A9J6FYX4_HAELO|nr:hypothetical protein HPB48_020377 [Haemaphysalis longicornis]
MATRLVPEEDGWMKVLRKGQVPANPTTLIPRPQEGFTLADFRPAALMIAIRNAANLLPSEANATYITIHQHQNIAVIRTLQKLPRRRSPAPAASTLQTKPGKYASSRCPRRTLAKELFTASMQAPRPAS